MGVRCELGYRLVAMRLGMGEVEYSMREFLFSEPLCACCTLASVCATRVRARVCLPAKSVGWFTSGTPGGSLAAVVGERRGEKKWLTNEAL